MLAVYCAAGRATSERDAMRLRARGRGELACLHTVPRSEHGLARGHRSVGTAAAQSGSTHMHPADALAVHRAPGRPIAFLAYQSQSAQQCGHPNRVLLIFSSPRVRREPRWLNTPRVFAARARHIHSATVLCHTLAHGLY